MTTARALVGGVVASVALGAGACGGAGAGETDFLNPPLPVEPLSGAYVFEGQVPVYGRRGGTERVEGELRVADGRFELTTTHGACAGALEPDQPDRQRIRCQGVELDTRWAGSRWAARLTVQVVEMDEEEVCVQRDSSGGCAQSRVETQQRPVRRSVDVDLFRLGTPR